MRSRPLAERSNPVVRLTMVVEVEVRNSDALLAAAADPELYLDDGDGPDLVCAVQDQFDIDIPGCDVFHGQSQGQVLRAERGDELLDWGPDEYRVTFYGGSTRRVWATDSDPD